MNKKYIYVVKLLLCISFIQISSVVSAQDDLSAYKFLKLDANHLCYDST